MNLKHNIFRDLKPSLLLSSILGINFVFPYYKQHANKSSLIFSQLSKVINILIISTYSCCLIYFCISFEIYKENKYYHLPIIKTATMYITIGNAIYFYLVYISAFYLSNKLKYIIEKFHKLDCTLYSIKKCTNDNKFDYNLLLLLLSTSMVYIVLTISISTIFVPSKSIAGEFKILWILFYYPVIIEVIVEHQYAFLIYLLYKRMAFIDEIVHHLYNSEEKNNNTLKQEMKIETLHEAEKFETTNKIKTLIRAYISVHLIAKNINLGYGILITSFYLHVYIKAIIYTLYIYFEVFVSKNLWSIPICTMWFVLLLKQLFFLLVPCTLFYSEVINLTGTIHMYIINEKKTVVREKLLKLSDEIFQQKIEFSACGIFPMKLETLQTIILNGSMYSFLLLQFFESSRCSN